MGRGTGKGKRGGGRTGGRKMFVDNIEEMQMREAEVAESRKVRAERRGESDSDDEEGGDVEKSPAVDSDRDAVMVKMAAARKAVPAATSAVEEPFEEDTVLKGLLGGLSVSNPNTKGGRTEFSVKTMGDAELVDQEAIMSRREREALEAARKKEEYMKRHLAGETDQAKADLARLAEVRARREQERLRREAEGRAPGMTAYGIEDEESDDDDDDDGSAKAKVQKAKAAPVMSERESKKRAAALGEVDSSAAGSSKGKAGVDEVTDLPKLKALDIKKMNGDALKESLKERKLSVQGQKKELVQRLIDYEAARS